MKQKSKTPKKPAKKKSLKRIAANLALLLMLAAAAFILLSPVIFTDTRAIVVDGKRYAFIRAKNMTSSEFNLLLKAKLKERYGKNVEINEDVGLEKAHAAKKDISSNVDVVIANLCDTLTVKGECGAVLVNGEVICILKSVNEAEKLVAEILDSYTPEKTDGSSVVGVEFKDDVKVEAYYADNDEILGAEQARDKLTQTEEKQYVYTVKSGDSFNSIATRFNIDEEELLSINPDITDENKAFLQIGQKINVKAAVPIYGVYTVTLEKERETYEAPEEEIENMTQYKGYRRVISEGSSGEKMTAYKVYYENGVEVKREPDPDKDEILTEAVPRQVEVGTLENAEDVKAAVGSFDYPIHGSAYYSSGFGSRDYGSGRHFGIDIACPSGTPVYASDGGTVVYAGWNNGGYGNWVVIDHGNSFKTIYAHNSAVLVHPGQLVSKGQVLSLVGSTGDSTGDHLHFEIRLNDRPKDPLEFLA